MTDDPTKGAVVASMRLQPRGHADPEFLAAKRARLGEPHVQPLNDLVRAINTDRDLGRTAPWFDPDGGGVRARVLFLLECPGPQSSAHRGSGIISADNDDQTAANFFALRDEAGLRRSDLIAWNIVPWYLPSVDGKRTLNATRADVIEAAPWLGRLVRLLPDLDLVVTMGGPAREGWMRYLTTTPDAPLLPTLAVPHPSPRTLNTDPDARPRILTAMRRAAHLLNGATRCP